MSQSRNDRRIIHHVMVFVLVAAFIVPFLAVPQPLLAASTSDVRHPRVNLAHNVGRMIHPLWITAEVDEVKENSVKLLLEGRGHDQAMLRQMEWYLTLVVDEDSILLDGDFNPVAIDALEVGTPVVFVPRLVWGTLGVRLLYTGSPEALSDATYIGRATMVDENTLELQRWGRDVTVVVDDATIWYDDGKRGRPDELYEDTLVRLIGVEEDVAVSTEGEGDEADMDTEQDMGSETVVRAVLITPGKRGF